MAFVAEDGTGLANANSYATVAYADAYFTDRGITAWTGLNAVKEGALIRATDYIEGRFSFKWEPFSEDQALHFPVQDCDDEDTAAEMPDKLLKATCEYALRALTGQLAPDPEVDDRGYRVVSKTEKVGPLEESTTYAEGGVLQRFRPYPAADILLRGLVNNSKRVIRG
jgi:hypothetical protein